MRLIIVPTVLTLSMLALAACGGRFTGATFGDSSLAFSSADASAAHAPGDLGSGDPESIDETYQQMDALMGEAYDELARVVADVWGQEHMEMPSRKVFIQYEDDMTQRTVIDFEKGEFRVERLAQPGEDEAEAMEALRAAVDQAMHATPMGMAETDTLMKYAKKMAGDKGIFSVIAAYNTGAGNVARAFTGTTRVGSAARVINTLTPDQVFDHLKTNLPFEETQRYIVKITNARTNYLAWDN